MGRRPGDPVFRCANKDSPDYKPQYGKTYTARQQAILDEQIPLDDIRATELSLLSKKAFQLGDLENYQIAQDLLQRKMDPGVYVPPYTVEEAKEILQKLTPWKIDWEK